MDSFSRVFPFVWPHRRKLFVSFVFAILVAFLWGANLSVVFPVVKVLLQGQSLAEYVDAEIVVHDAEIQHRNSRLQDLDSEILAIKANGARAETSVRNAKEQSRQRDKLSTASRKLLAMEWIKTYVLPSVPTDQFDTYALLLAILLAATTLKGLAIFVQDVLIGSIVELAVMAIRKECFRRTLALDYQTIALKGTADLMSRFTNDINVMANGLLLLGGKVVREPLKAATCVVLAFAVNWQLTLMSLLFVPVMGIVFYRYGKILKHASHRMMESMSRIYKSLEETFDSLKIVIAFDGARRHRQRFHRENKEFYRKAMQVVKVDALTSPTTELLGMLAVLIALLPGAYLVLRNTDEIWGIRLSSGVMDIAQLSLLYAFLAGTIDPVRKLSSVYAKLKRSAAATDRIFTLIGSESLVKPPKHPKMLPRHAKSISFQHIEFTYAGVSDSGRSLPPSLEDINLDVEAGEVVAVVGENGSGKSTLINLLPRYYDPSRGAVSIDGVDIREVRPRDLRAQIGIVTQETLLFDDTIYENIRYGKLNASADEVRAAADKAHVTQFANQLPDGFDTRVGEKGQRLSGGQRQRIALARALLRDPAILILDEATSAVDAQSESLIHQVLANFSAGRTVFLITHSLSPTILDFVTRIVVLEHGKLVATGSHDTLLRTCPTYDDLYHSHVEKRGNSDVPSLADAADSDESTALDGESPEESTTADVEFHVIPFPVPPVRISDVPPGGKTSRLTKRSDDEPNGKKTAT